MGVGRRRWLVKRGALDFAGGTVVHLSSGISALVCAIVIGKRLGYPAASHAPHNLTMTVTRRRPPVVRLVRLQRRLGARRRMALAALAFANTHLAAAAGALAWGLVEAARFGKVTMLGVASGLVAGLVAITPAAGFVAPMAAIVIGAVAGVVCYGGVLAQGQLGYDDALDAFGVHGVGGALGALLTGVFARAALNNGIGGGLSWSVSR